MDLNALIEALGYQHSEQHWVTLETADPRLRITTDLHRGQEQKRGKARRSSAATFTRRVLKIS